MGSIAIIIFALLVRWLISITTEKKWMRGVLQFLGSSLPLILIITKVIENDGISIIFAGICLFWFALIKDNQINKSINQ